MYELFWKYKKETLEQLKIGLRMGCKVAGISCNGELIKILEKKKLSFLKIKEGLVSRAA